MGVKVVDNTIHSVKGILYKEVDGGRLFLMTKEADTGLFGFPGGAEDEEDTDYLSTLKREVHEEIGLSEKAYEIVDPAITHEFVHEDPNSPRYLKKGVLHVYLLKYNGNEVVAPSDELESVVWLSSNSVLENLIGSYAYWNSVFEKVLRYLDGQ